MTSGGIAASGRTPYVLVGSRMARSRSGALTIGLSCTSVPRWRERPKLRSSSLPGPEIDHRLDPNARGDGDQAGAEYAEHRRHDSLGYVYGNLMVNVQATNEKLTDRARRIIQPMQRACPMMKLSRLLERGRSVRTAIVMHRRKLSRGEAERELAAARGRLRTALKE